jgi:glycosyltransferase involved in cell wall biosynthesis
VAKIVTVYADWKRDFMPSDMSYIRWLKISQALAERGHQVDIATNEREFSRLWWPRKSEIPMLPKLRRLPLAGVRWSEYDVVKTLFGWGFETLEAYGGASHPFIISKLGSVVGPTDMDGIYFYGDVQKKMYSTQQRINRISKYITLLTKPAKDLWENCFGPKSNILLVPGAVDRIIPGPSSDPYPQDGRARCIFAGHIYVSQVQEEANTTIVTKLNRLGELLDRRGIRLYMIGSGDVSKLDRKWVSYLGVVPYTETWNYFYFAGAGLVVSAGSHMHNNESSKIYHYLRAGLPVVSERGFPNDYLIEESRLGFSCKSGDMELLAETIEQAVHTKWDRNSAIQYILNHHTWDSRVDCYDKLIREVFN